MTEATTRHWVRRGLDLGRASRPSDRMESVGDLELAPFQSRAVGRGREIVETFGGTIVADAVGLGKTRVVLGICRALRKHRALSGEESQTVLCCVPARLRGQWRRSLQVASVESHRLVSHTEMSREPAAVSETSADVVIVDEAHRFRNPDAKRSRALAELCVDAPVVMATATPVCNGIRDLYHLFALFVAEHDLRGVVGYDLEEAFDAAERGEFDLTLLVEELVIRRVTAPDEGAFGERPSARLEIIEYEPEEAEAWIWDHLEERLREVEFAAFDRDWPEGLFVEHVLRRWESGPAALLETIDELEAYHRRWLEARRHGRRLDRSDFRALFEAPSDREQAVFPFLFADAEASDEPAAVETVERDLERIETIGDRARDVVSARFGPTRRICRLAESLEERLLIFTRYRRAAGDLYEALRERLGSRGRVGLVTGNRSEATGLGRCDVDEMLRRFAPNSYGDRRLPAHQRIRVLVGTDTLSEGVNLQDCGHVVLADLPYSALVVEQRIGRLVRPGSPHDEVRVYLPRPTDWSDALGLRRRLRRKLLEAETSGIEFAAADSSLFEASGTEGGTDSREREGASSVEEAGRLRMGPERMARPAPPNEPLAAMTKLDGLRRRLGPAEGSLEETWWRAAAPVDEPALWVAVERRRGTSRALRWLLVRRELGVESRRAALVGPLVSLADAALDLEAAQPPEPLRRRAADWVASRQERLRAAALAPVPLSWESPQYRLWQRLERAVDRDVLDEGDAELEALRHRLLRPFPRGVERRLEALAEERVAAVELVDEVRRLTELVESPDAEVELEMRSGVHLLPRPP